MADVIGSDVNGKTVDTGGARAALLFAWVAQWQWP